MIIGIQCDFPFFGCLLYYIQFKKTFSSTEGTGFKPEQITVFELMKDTEVTVPNHESNEYSQYQHMTALHMVIGFQKSPYKRGKTHIQEGMTFL